MGYSVASLEFPESSRIREFIQNDNTAIFYEIAHGGSYSFRNGCPEQTASSDIESWMNAYASMPFTFIASCYGMHDVGDGTLSWEFMKGSSRDAVTVGYFQMSEEGCSDCWHSTVEWQDMMFRFMAEGYTVKESFDIAVVAFPDCSRCVRFRGDEQQAVVPRVTRSLCGEYSGEGSRGLTYATRDYYIRCDVVVPEERTLSIDAGVDLAFMHDSKLISYGLLRANGSHDEIRLVTAEHEHRGIRFSGQLRMMNGGTIKIFE
jgi:hypothetical protein